MSEEQRSFLKARIQVLQSRKRLVGPFRRWGIQRTIDGMKRQLRLDVWEPSER